MFANLSTHYCLQHTRPSPSTITLQFSCSTHMSSRLCQWSFVPPPTFTISKLSWPISNSQHLQLSLRALMAVTASLLLTAAGKMCQNASSKQPQPALKGIGGHPLLFPFGQENSETFSTLGPGFLSGMKLQSPMVVDFWITYLFWHPFFSPLISP